MARLAEVGDELALLDSEELVVSLVLVFVDFEALVVSLELESAPEFELVVSFAQALAVLQVQAFVAELEVA